MQAIQPRVRLRGGTFVGIRCGSESCVAFVGGVSFCPPAWSNWEDKCYRFTNELTWRGAKQECIEMGSVLVVPKSQRDEDALGTSR